jgi:alkanesulfonate monooxygenase SsuD/methylene tetrahydromethanopterin reductase-like flavin-dependent oxidoreductase (luciferase family)
MQAQPALLCGLSLIGLSPRNYREVSAAAEAAGFDSIWVPEHIVFPSRMPAEYPYATDGDSGFPATTPLFDPWVSLAYVACVIEILGSQNPREG